MSSLHAGDQTSFQGEEDPVQPRVAGVHGATTLFIRVAPIFFTALALSQTSEHLSLLHGAFVVGRVSYMEFEALGAVLQEIADLKAELGA